MCLSFDPRIGSNRHKFKTPLLLSKIVVGWTSGSCIQALWRGSKRAFPDEVSGCSAPKAHENLVRRGGMARASAPGKHLRFKNKLFSLDATIVELCLEMFDWARYRQTKGSRRLSSHDATVWAPDGRVWHNVTMDRRNGAGV